MSQLALPARPWLNRNSVKGVINRRAQRVSIRLTCSQNAVRMPQMATKLRMKREPQKSILLRFAFCCACCIM